MQLLPKKAEYVYDNEETLTEEAVWENDIKKHFANAKQNVRSIWIYGFMEIFNNAIEHSGGNKITVIVNEDEMFTSIAVIDNGIGIFKNIKNTFKLNDEKDALLELSKGKRTTDIKRHSGQGIFFSSKFYDTFIIKSNNIIYNGNIEEDYQFITEISNYSTYVFMRLANNSNRKAKDVIDEYSTESPGDFDKTIVPVILAESNDLVSRSQARRLLSGLELFKEVTLDFKDIEYIGQAFADEIFRVFPNMNTDTMIQEINTNTDVQNMINRARNLKL